METRINNIKCKQMYFKKRGKNLLKNTAESKVVKGITFTVNDDKTVIAKGTTTGTPAIIEVDGTLHERLRVGERYIVSGVPSHANCFIKVRNVDTGDTLAEPSVNYPERTFTYSGGVISVQCLVRTEGVTVDNVLFKPMIRKADIADATYEPYEDFVAYKKVYVDGVLVFSAGNPVTYVVDTGVEHTEEVESGASCLSYTPTKSGYTFVGWRKDKTASAEVETNLVMGDEPITLYAVFGKDVTLTYAGNGATSGSTAPDTEKAYYNNGNETPAIFILAANGFTRTDYTFKGWSMGAVGASVELSADATATAQWRINQINTALRAYGSNTVWSSYTNNWYANTYDLTDVSKITIYFKCHYTDTQSNGDAENEKWYYNAYEVIAGVSSNKSSYAKSATRMYGDHCYTPTQTLTITLTIDVSALSGNYYIGVGSRGGSTMSRTDWGDKGYICDYLESYATQTMYGEITKVEFVY